MKVSCYTFHGVWGDEKVCAALDKQGYTIKEFGFPFARLRAMVYSLFHG